MSRASREKGKRGEREVADVFRRAGFKDAHRTGQMQANGLGTNADVGGLPSELHVESKRDERMSVDAMVRQAEADKKPGQQAIVAWRRNGGRWRADVDLEWLAHVLHQLHDEAAQYVVSDGHVTPVAIRPMEMVGKTDRYDTGGHMDVTPMSRSEGGDSHAPIQKTVDRELKLLEETADEGGV